LPQRKAFFSLLEKIINDNNEIFIGTKNSIFLPWQNLEKIIVYDEVRFFIKNFLSLLILTIEKYF
jgi:primosomal protein N'